MTQHASLTPERWAAFSLDQQVLMIANEMNRSQRLVHAGDSPAVARGYERIFSITDLTARGSVRPTFRRELLRWRGLIAALYAAGSPDLDGHREALRALLLLRPLAAKQIPYLLP